MVRTDPGALSGHPLFAWIDRRGKSAQGSLAHGVPDRCKLRSPKTARAARARRLCAKLTRFHWRWWAGWRGGG